MAIRVLLVERVTLLAEAIKAVLMDAEMDVVGTFSTPPEAIAFLERDQPDVIVMELDLMDDLSIETIMKRRPFGGRPDDWMASGRLILKRWPDARILLLSFWGDPQAADRALRSGFRGFLTRGSTLTELVGAVQVVADGQTVLSTDLLPLSDEAPEDYPDMSLLAEPPSDLTEKEQRVFDLLLEGAGTRDIAQRLSISNLEAAAHIKSALRKLRLEGRFDD